MRNSYSLVILLLVAMATGCFKDDTTIVEVTPNDFLSGNKYDKLKIELLFQQGDGPTSDTESAIRDFLNKRLNKPGGITYVINNVEGYDKKSTYSLAEVKEIEKSTRTEKTDGTTLTVFIFFADAAFSENSGNSNVLGFAYGTSSIVIFEKTIRGLASGTGQTSLTTLETVVTEHELGHLMGLVNNGSAMQTEHQDEPHGKHCDDTDCLMYHTTETFDILSNLLGGNVPSLNAQCLSDLKANGGK